MKTPNGLGVSRHRPERQWSKRMLNFGSWAGLPSERSGGGRLHGITVFRLVVSGAKRRAGRGGRCVGRTLRTPTNLLDNELQPILIRFYPQQLFTCAKYDLGLFSYQSPAYSRL
jgi:hypothetical protein